MTVRVERDGAVTTVTLDRDAALNAWDLDMMSELAATVTKLEEDPDVRAVVLTGHGRGFCAGIDLAALDEARQSGTARDYVAEVTKHHHEATLTMLRGGTPWVAAINGAAAGGGLALAMACDIRIAVPSARFVSGYLRVAVAPDGGTTWLLPRLIGLNRARDMLLLNDVIEAPKAETWGLVTEVVDDEHLMSRARELAGELAARPRQALALTKARLADVQELDRHLAIERDGTIASTETDEFEEGVEAFRERRRPEFG